MPRLTCLVLVALVLTGRFAAADPPGRLALEPAEAFQKLAHLDGRKPAVTEDEDRLFQDARTGKFGRLSFSEACLIAGGITDPHDRKRYLDRLDALEAQARKVTAGTKSVAEDGARLLKFLHAGPMAKGYKEEQSDLHVLLETGQFNCVSSAVLYTVMGQRLGIDVRAVTVPRHVFSVLVTRDRRIDVETTNARGFDLDPLRRDGPAKADRPRDNRREVGPPGLAALVAFNNGVGLIEKKRYPEAVRANTFALGLDPDSPGASKNLVVALGHWMADLAEAGKAEQALDVIATGHELLPKEPKLQRLAVELCDAWAKGYIDREDWANAAEVYRRGLRAFPDDKQLTNKLVFCRLRMP
jgi:tetratricopeptide (TPR) repeat protein